MALEMQNFEALSPPVVKKITWWTLVHTKQFLVINFVKNSIFHLQYFPTLNSNIQFSHYY